jgi:hypothetical protein
VRLLARWEEMRADFLGENGSQESLKPCLGETGVWTLPGGDGVETAMDVMSMAVSRATSDGAVEI